MADTPRKNLNDTRSKHNSDLIRRMRNGEQLNAVDSKASWYPPRPVIKKDTNEMARLYTGVERRKTPRVADGVHLNVVTLTKAPGSVDDAG